MSPTDWALRPLKKYADFSGRAPRAEFWWYCLFIIIAAVLAMMIDSALGLGKVFLMYGPVMLLLIAATFVPGLAVQVRRLHDTNRSGFWLLALYVPYGALLALMPSMMAPGVNGVPDVGSAAVYGLLSLIVLAMAIMLIVFYVRRGTEGPNNYGPDPYGGTVEQAFA